MSMTRTAFRLDESALARADALIPMVKKMHAMGPVRRSDVLREALERGLAELELELERAAEPR